MGRYRTRSLFITVDAMDMDDVPRNEGDVWCTPGRGKTVIENV